MNQPSSSVRIGGIAVPRGSHQQPLLRPSAFKRVLSLLCLMLASTFTLQAWAGVGPSKSEARLLLMKRDQSSTRAIESALASVKGRSVAKYHAMHAVVVPTESLERFYAQLGSIDVTILDNVIHTPGRRINPPEELNTGLGRTDGLFVIQFAAPALPEWQQAVAATGAVEILPLQSTASVVSATLSQAKLLAELSFIQYIRPVYA